MDWKRALFGEPTETRSVPETPAEPLAADGTILDFIRAGQQSALNVSTFFRGVQLISTAISQLPIYTKRVNGKGDSNIIKNHPTNLLWTDPNNLVDKTTMIRSIIQSVICKGNAYCYIQRAADGTPTGLRYLPSGDVTLYYTKERNELYYTCSYINHGKRIMPADMLHFKLFTWDGIKGVSVISFASNTIDLTNATESQAKAYFEKGCSNISGVIQAAGVVSDKQKKQILSTWAGTFGRSKAGVAVLEGNLKYEPITINPSDSQMLESREFNSADVCQWLNINPAQLGLKGYQHYTNFEDANNELLQRTLMAYIVMLENELTRKLVGTEKNTKIILDTVQFLRPNKQSQSAYYTALVNSGILSINEIRKELGYAEIEGGDEHHIPYSDVAQNSIEGKANNVTKDEDNGDKEITE